MPTATTTKSAMAGTKRKSAPAKDSNVKENKKPKFDSGKKSALKTKTKSKALPAKKAEELTNEDSEDSDSDGGVPLSDSEDVDMDDAEPQKQDEEESGSEDVPMQNDGIHPDRAKAVVTNSKIAYSTSKVPN
jgi:pumilio family protein 6